jgi:hypothetical protein
MTGNWKANLRSELRLLARLPTVEILPPGIDPTMIDATCNQVEEVTGD